jgi:3alpha(or 20beta)-hydroxysteroid dehydrogenase
VARLEGKIAIVTGAGRGQGAATARRFVEEGASVVLGDVLEQECRQLAAVLGPRAIHCKLDVSRSEDWANAVRVAQTLGPLNVLVNNAGVHSMKRIEDLDEAEFQRIISINQIGTYLGMKAVVEPMTAAGGGSIVNLSSIDGIQAKSGMFAYVATKWAIRGMTKAAALELGKFGIRVNSVHPGGIYTDMGNPFNIDKKDLNRAYKHLPLRRVGESVEIANMNVFLASDDSSYSTGSEFVADGGWLAGDIYDF